MTDHSAGERHLKSVSAVLSSSSLKSMLVAVIVGSLVRVDVHNQTLPNIRNDHRHNLGHDRRCRASAARPAHRQNRGRRTSGKMGPVGLVGAQRRRGGGPAGERLGGGKGGLPGGGASAATARPVSGGRILPAVVMRRIGAVTGMVGRIPGSGGDSKPDNCTTRDNREYNALSLNHPALLFATEP
jgi:hypothetical protein